LSKKGRDYRESALIAIAAHNLTLRQLDGRLQVSLDLHPPTLRKYDADNYCKAIFDSLTHGGVWLDDEQVDSLHVLKCPKDADNPRVVVTITELEKN
jgi:crossover junction endodeoxyribonuclease RusA